MTLGPAQHAALVAFCSKWGIEELSLFGSVARGDARPDSDADILVRFAPNSATSTWDWPGMVDELEAIFGRRVDLLTDAVLRNPYRRASIMADRRVLYAA
ncbi:MAG: nucleotidyltransferase family protein [Phycisphaeraceae bacterium]|nr:MAG: nucleotidyltransferase family protein [Phycisphaeraceae bacterium]